MQHDDQKTPSNDAPAISEPAPFSTYYVKGRFVPEKAVERLLSGTTEYGEASILMTGLMCWVVAPEEPKLLKRKLLDRAVYLLGRYEKRSSEKTGKETPVGNDLNLMHLSKTRWLYAAFQALGGWSGIRRNPAPKELRNILRKQARYAAYAGDLVCAIHRHTVHLSKIDRKYGKASLKRAQAAMSQLLQHFPNSMIGSKIDVPGKKVQQAETIRSEVLAPRRASAAWCYALNIFYAGDLPLVVKFAEKGTVPKGLAKDIAKLANLAGIALFVQDDILTQLPVGSKSMLPRFQYPRFLESVPFSVTPYSEEELAIIRTVAEDDRYAGGRP